MALIRCGNAGQSVQYGSVLIRENNGTMVTFGNIDTYWANGASGVLACDTSHLTAAGGNFTFKIKSRVTVYDNINSTVTSNVYDVNDTFAYPTAGVNSKIYVFEEA